MPHDQNSGTKIPERRRIADAASAWKARDTVELTALSAEEVLRFVHELQERQNEMETEIQELRQAQTEVQELKNGDKDQYNSATVGYVTLNDKGLILEANLATVRLLGVEAQRLIKVPFSRFVSPQFEDGHAFDSYLQKVFETRSEQTCEIELKREDGTHFYAQLQSVAIQDENGQFKQCQTTVIDITERKKGEEALRESERLFRTIFDQAAVGVAQIISKTGQYFRINKKYCDILGYTPEQLRGRTFQEITYPEDLQTDLNNINLLIEGKVREFSIEKRYRRQDGTIIWGNLTIYPMWDSDEQPNYHLAIMQDITDRKHAEKALAESEERYRKLFNNAPIGIFQTHSQGNVQFMNPYMAKMVSAESPEEAVAHFSDLGKHLYADSQRREQFVRTLQEEGRVTEFEYEAVRMDGSHRWFSMNAQVCERSTDGTFLIDGFTSDITDRKRTEESLKESEERYRQIADNSLTGIFLYQDGRIIYANRRLAEMIGCSPAHMLNMPFLEPIHPDDRHMVRDMVHARLSGNPGSDDHYQVRLLHKDGHTVWSELSSHRIDHKGRPAILGNIADVTESRILRQQLLQIQKMEAIGTLTGGIAHDFNNLLTIMNGYVELILSQTTDDDPIAADLKKVLETGQKGAEMVQRLQAFSQRSQIEPRCLDVNLTLEKTVHLLRKTFPKIIEIETVFGKEGSMIYADTIQVEQVVMNLCINAKEALQQGGRIKIETKSTYLDDDYCRLHLGTKPGKYVLIAISDTGIGMDNETVERIFDPFFTTKGWDFRKGTGLGLSVSKGIMEQHGGSITCQSEPGRGSTFSLYFPVVEGSAVPQKPEPPKEGALDSGQVLLVDDEELVRDLGKRVLQRAGYNVMTAANGREALEIYVKEQANIRLVVLDLIMPEMGGEQCLAELVKINPQIRIIISSGHSLALQDRERLAAATGFVNKPYQMKQLLEVVRQVLDSK